LYSASATLLRRPPSMSRNSSWVMQMSPIVIEQDPARLSSLDRVSDRQHDRPCHLGHPHADKAELRPTISFRGALAAVLLPYRNALPARLLTSVRRQEGSLRNSVLMPMAASAPIAAAGVACSINEDATVPSSGVARRPASTLSA